VRHLEHRRRRVFALRGLRHAGDRARLDVVAEDVGLRRVGIVARARRRSRRGEQDRPPVGSEGRLSRGSSSVPVAIDEEMLAELKRAADNNDASGIGPIFIVSDGTTVRVSESGRSGLRVRILDGSQKGRVGWVSFDWVKPLGNSN